MAFTVKNQAQPVPIKSPIQIEELQPKQVKRPDFDIEVLEPLRATQKAEADKLAAIEAERVRQAEEAARIEAERVASLPKLTYTYSPVSYTGGLIAGRAGFIAPGNNCVDWVKNFRSVPFGNPISWSPITHTPFIGALVLFSFNHVARVEGIYADGSVAVSHANAPGAPVRYALSQVRGFL